MEVFMTFKIDQLSYDLIQGRIMVALNKNDGQSFSHITVNVPMHKHASETEAEIKEKAKIVVKQALEEALKVL
jgi:hypothetical protein